MVEADGARRAVAVEHVGCCVRVAGLAALTHALQQVRAFECSQLLVGCGNEARFRACILLAHQHDSRVGRNTAVELLQCHRFYTVVHCFAPVGRHAFGHEGVEGQAERSVGVAVGHRGSLECNQVDILHGVEQQRGAVSSRCSVAH